MKDHALICKLSGAWLIEKELIKWIQQIWQPKGQISLKLGANGFFIVIISNLEEKLRVFKDGPYFSTMQDSSLGIGKSATTHIRRNSWLPNLGSAIRLTIGLLGSKDLRRN